MVAPRFFMNNGESKKTNSIAQKKPIVLKKINASELDNNKLKEFKIYENIIIDDFDKIKIN